MRERESSSCVPPLTTHNPIPADDSIINEKHAAYKWRLASNNGIPFPWTQSFPKANNEIPLQFRVH